MVWQSWTSHPLSTFQSQVIVPLFVDEMVQTWTLWQLETNVYLISPKMVHISSLRCKYDPLRVQPKHLYPECSQLYPIRTLFSESAGKLVLLYFIRFLFDWAPVLSYFGCAYTTLNSLVCPTHPSEVLESLLMSWWVESGVLIKWTPKMCSAGGTPGPGFRNTDLDE